MLVHSLRRTASDPPSFTVPTNIILTPMTIIHLPSELPEACPRGVVPMPVFDPSQRRGHRLLRQIHNPVRSRARRDRRPAVHRIHFWRWRLQALLLPRARRRWHAHDPTAKTGGVTLTIRGTGHSGSPMASSTASIFGTKPMATPAIHRPPKEKPFKLAPWKPPMAQWASSAPVTAGSRANSFAPMTAPSAFTAVRTLGSSIAKSPSTPRPMPHW